MVVTFSRDGYVKRTPLDTYRAQGRGGRGVKGSESKEGDVISSVFVAGTHDYVLCFSNLGKVYWLKVYQIPEGSRTSRGRAIRNLLELADGEKIRSLLRVPSFDQEAFVVFATKGGTVKKTALEAYSRPKKVGIRAIALDEDDEVVDVSLAEPGDTVLIASATGRAVRFDEAAARAMGRVSRGVRGMRLREGDAVVSMVVLSGGQNEGLTLVTACEHGYGKRTPADDYPIKGRGGQGVINIKVTERNGKVVSVRPCTDKDDLLLISTSGMMVRIEAVDARPMGRNTQGVRLVNLKDDDVLAGVEVVKAEDIEFAARSGAGTVEAGDGAPLAAVPTDEVEDAGVDEEPEAEDDETEE
ncbi:MAG: DNA gyrase C-terminal beta-propeller domain-containing protein [Planctomycetota bacterium]